ncbi:MAG: hypothetical protein VXZ40_00245 [Nanoarchaeota archaeon]|nr:hypothetical protein [Nanoarchaeota archaeon]
MGRTNFNFILNGIIITVLTQLSFGFDCNYFEQEKEICQQHPELIPNLILKDSTHPNHEFVTEFNNNQDIEIETISKKYLKDVYLKITRIEPSIIYQNQTIVPDQTTVYTQYDYKIELPKSNKECKNKYEYQLNEYLPQKQEVTSKLKIEKQLHLKLIVKEKTYAKKEDGCKLKKTYTYTEQITLRDQINLSRIILNQSQFTITDIYGDTMKGQLESYYNTNIHFDNSFYEQINFIYTPQLNHNYLSLRAVKVNQSKKSNLTNTNNNLYINSENCQTTTNSFFNKTINNCSKNIIQEPTTHKQKQDKSSLGTFYLLSIFALINYIIFKFLKNQKFFIIPLLALLLIPNPTFAIFNESRDRGRENSKSKTYSNSKEII